MAIFSLDLKSALAVLRTATTNARNEGRKEDDDRTASFVFLFIVFTFCDFFLIKCSYILLISELVPRGHNVLSDPSFPGDLVMANNLQMVSYAISGYSTGESPYHLNCFQFFGL